VETEAMVAVIEERLTPNPALQPKVVKFPPDE
jgi:hypothetical protein